MESPLDTHASSFESPNIFLEMKEADVLPTTTIRVICNVSAHNSILLKTMRRSTSSPTDSRKKGTKRASPIKDIRVINGLCPGTSRFTTRPTRKAPMMCARPTYSARKAPEKSSTIKNTNSTSGCLRTVLKNQSPRRGTISNTAAPDTAASPRNEIPNDTPIEPSVTATTTASSVSDTTSVTIVPPMVIVTAACRRMPSLCTTGYASSVCEPAIAATKRPCAAEYPSRTPKKTMASTAGIEKESNPKTMLRLRCLVN